MTQEIVNELNELMTAILNNNAACYIEADEHILNKIHVGMSARNSEMNWTFDLILDLNKVRKNRQELITNLVNLLSSWYYLSMNESIKDFN